MLNPGIVTSSFITMAASTPSPVPTVDRTGPVSGGEAFHYPSFDLQGLAVHQGVGYRVSGG